jgi:hypothetical protein
MPLDKTALLNFLGEVDVVLERMITLVAVGGTALTLLDTKPSTIDADFTLPTEDFAIFKRSLRLIPHGFKVDCWDNGQVFSQFLPNDYIKRSIPIRRMKHIELRALNPLDIVVTKIGRLDSRDKEDVEACIKKFKLTKKQITSRAKRVHYVGRDQNYKINLDYVLKNFFK